jgi:hypothetical protein
MRRTGAVLAVSLVLVFLSTALMPVAASPSGGASGKVVILVVDRIAPGDITRRETPFLADLASRWSCGLLVTHTAEKETGKEPDLGAEYVSLGAGTRARGSRDAALSFDPAETMASGTSTTTAGDYYQRSTGLSPPPRGVVCLGLPDVEVNNKDSGTADNVSLLATLLAASGKQAAATGNEDSYRRPVRLAPLIVCGTEGTVPRGQVAGFSRAAGNRPGGYRTDMTRLMSSSLRLLGQSEVLVIDTGDTGRVDRESATMAPGALERARRSALERVDDFAASFVPALDLESSLLLVVSPGAPMSARPKGDYTTPFIAAGKGFASGLLTSSSTMRPGLVNNADFLPTVMSFFGAGVPSKVTGSTMKTAGKAPGGKTALAYIQDLDRQFHVTRAARWPAVLGYVILVGVFLLLGLACLPYLSRRLRGGRWRNALMRALGPVSVVVVAAPLSFLLVSAFSYNSGVFPVLFCGLYTLAVGLGAYFLARDNERLDPVTLVCVFSASVMVIDLLFGGRLLVFPLLGSSSLEGMRFFGQSNAVTGMMLGYAVWGVAGLAGDGMRGRTGVRWAALAALALVSFTIGFGGLGANFGGFVAAVATSLIFFFATSEAGFKRWRIPAIAAITLGATAMIVLIDDLFVHTHAGRAVAGGAGAAVPMFGRKILILIGQIKSVLFLALLMIALVIALALWMKRPATAWASRWKTDPAFTGALFAVATGSVVALLFNDTGIAMMGTMVLITIPTVTYHFVRGAPGASKDLRLEGSTPPSRD